MCLRHDPVVISSNVLVEVGVARNFNLIMVPPCNHLSSNTICLTLSVHCFYNFTYFVFDMYGGQPVP